MSYPSIAESEATLANIKKMLDEGKWLYIPIPYALEGLEQREMPVFLQKETGKYLVEINASAGEHRLFDATEEGLTQLACFLAFTGVNYI